MREAAVQLASLLGNRNASSLGLMVHDPAMLNAVAMCKLLEEVVTMKITATDAYNKLRELQYNEAKLGNLADYFEGSQLSNKQLMKISQFTQDFNHFTGPYGLFFGPLDGREKTADNQQLQAVMFQKLRFEDGKEQPTLNAQTSPYDSCKEAFARQVDFMIRNQLLDSDCLTCPEKLINLRMIFQLRFKDDRIAHLVGTFLNEKCPMLEGITKLPALPKKAKKTNKKKS